MKQNFIEDNIIILSKQTIDKMLEQEHPADLIGLYSFYYYTAKWQKTNIIKCTTNYVQTGLKWTKEKVISSKKILIQMGLIIDQKRKNEKGQITGWYIKINYVWKRENVVKFQRVASPEGGKTHRVENPDTNALSANNKNALSANNSKTSFANKNSTLIEILIKAFEKINPACKNYYRNTTQRNACSFLIKEFGFERVKKIIDTTLPKTNGLDYFPTITTPYKLQIKWSDLEVAIKRYISKKNTQKQKVGNVYM